MRIDLTPAQVEAVQMLLHANSEQSSVPPKRVCWNAFQKIMAQTGIGGRGKYCLKWCKKEHAKFKGD